MPLCLFRASSSLQVIDELPRVIGLDSWFYLLVVFSTHNTLVLRVTIPSHRHSVSCVHNEFLIYCSVEIRYGTGSLGLMVSEIQVLLT
jgi:hypothetical protein